MKLQARSRLKADEVNTKDRPPSTYLDEAEMDHAMPDGSAAPGPIGMGVGLGAAQRLLSTSPMFGSPGMEAYETL